MNQANNEIRRGGIEGGPGNVSGGSGGTEGVGSGPVAPSGSLLNPVYVLTGDGVRNEEAQVSPSVCVILRSENANNTCVSSESRPCLGIMTAREGDSGFQNEQNNSNLDDFNSSNNDAQSVSLLDMTGCENSNDFGDITYVEFPNDFDKSLNLNSNNIDNNTDSTDINVDNNIVKDVELEKNSDVEGNPKKKRISSAERRFQKKCRLEEEKGREFRDKNKNRPMSELQKKVNDEYKKKMSYAQCAKTHEMLEIRADNFEILLDQADFDKIDKDLLYKYAGMDIVEDPENMIMDEDDEDENVENQEPKFFYGLVGGISNGCCWFACDNKETADFVREHAPSILPPPPLSENYKYVVYSATEKPFRYMKCKIPKKMWNTKRKLQCLFKASNNCLNQKIPNSEGVLSNVHFKITAGCHDYKEEIINNRFFWIQMEVDEKLMPTLTGINQKGSLKLGASPINLIGGGIVSETKKQIEKSLTGDLADLVPEDLRA
jgi:hypothetical protein